MYDKNNKKQLGLLLVFFFFLFMPCLGQGINTIPMHRLRNELNGKHYFSANPEDLSQMLEKGYKKMFAKRK